MSVGQAPLATDGRPPSYSQTPRSACSVARGSAPVARGGVRIVNIVSVGQPPPSYRRKQTGNSGSVARGGPRTAFLEHGVHAQAIVCQLHRNFGIRPLPEDGVRITVHARYDVPGHSPPDSIVVAASTSAGEAPRLIVVHLFNWTGEGTSGFHYDVLRLS